MRPGSNASVPGATTRRPEHLQGTSTETRKRLSPGRQLSTTSTTRQAYGRFESQGLGLAKTSKYNRARHPSVRKPLLSAGVSRRYWCWKVMGVYAGLYPETNPSVATTTHVGEHGRRSVES